MFTDKLKSTRGL